MSSFFQGDNALSTLFEPIHPVAAGAFTTGTFYENNWVGADSITETTLQSFAAANAVAGISNLEITTNGTYRLQMIFWVTRMRDSGIGNVNVHLGKTAVSDGAIGYSNPSIDEIHSLQCSGFGVNGNGIVTMVNLSGTNNDTATNSNYCFRITGQGGCGPGNNLLSVDITFTVSTIASNVVYKIYPSGRYEGIDSNSPGGKIDGRWRLTKLI